MLRFRAIWYTTPQKNGADALGLQRVLGIGGYKTAWHGCTNYGVRRYGPTGIGFQGRMKPILERPEPAENAVGVAVETAGKAVGRIRIGMLKDASQSSLRRFITDSIEPGNTAVTGGRRGYSGLETIGYSREIIERQSGGTLLPHVHTVISLMKRRIRALNIFCVKRKISHKGTLSP